MNSCRETCGLSRSTASCCCPQCAYWHVWKYHLSATDKYLQWDITLKLALKKRCEGAQFSFGVHVVLVSQLNVAALCSLATHGFLHSSCLVFGPLCVRSRFSFISHEVLLAKGSGGCLGLTLGSSDDMARLRSWGPGLKVHCGAHLPCSEESASY